MSILDGAGLTETLTMDGMTCPKLCSMFMLVLLMFCNLNSYSMNIYQTQFHCNDIVY